MVHGFFRDFAVLILEVWMKTDHLVVDWFLEIGCGPIYLRIVCEFRFAEVMIR